MTKKLLIQFDTDTHTSAFDAVVAYDAGIDHLIPYAGITVDNVEGLVPMRRLHRPGPRSPRQKRRS